MSPVWAIWIFVRRDALLEEDLDLARPGVEAGREWAMIGAPVRTLARAAARWTFSIVLVDAGLVGGALDERRLDLGALDPLLDVVDEQFGHEVRVAVEKNCGR